MKLEDMSWDEAIIKCKDKIILVPHGSTEEHGFHLPLKTDTLVSEKICDIFYASEDVVVAPVMNYTCMRSTKQIPGTVGPNKDEYESWLKVIISDFMKLKPRKIFFFLGHYGNTVKRVLDRIIEEYGDEKINYLDAGSLSKQAYENGIIGSVGHAGEGETSIILYLDFKHVKMKKATDELWPENYKKVGISKSGVNGEPTKATTEKGKKLLKFYKKKLKETLEL